jgi:cell wall-associated NlpC family hydrolase
MLSGLAQAWTPAIQRAQNQAAALRDLVEQLDEELSAATEDYNYAAQQLEDTQAAIKKTQKQVKQSESDLATVQARLNQRVVDIYKSGDLTILAVLLDARSFSDLIGRYEQLQRLSKQDAELLGQIQGYKAQVSDHKARLDAEVKQEQVDVQNTEAAKQKIQAQLAKQKKALAGKEKQIAQLKREEAARQAALLAAAKKAAEEAERKAAAERAAREAAAKNKKPADNGSSGGSGAVGYDADKSAQVVDYALRFVGAPYVWAGSTPSGFDCSGFTQYVYKHFGIYLPHSSRMQAGYGTAVSRANLKPGDLVFFFSPIHHVGIYIGGGKMVNAAGTGKGVRIDYLWSSYNRACRILD